MRTTILNSGPNQFQSHQIINQGFIRIKLNYKKIYLQIFTCHSY